MEREYVGVDFHRRRSVLARRNGAGETLGVARVWNDPLEIAAALAEAGPEPEVVIEATYGWYWVVDFLQEQGARVHLAHPLGNNWGSRSGQERRARRHRLGRLVPPGPSRGVLDRPAGGEGTS